MNIEKNPTTGVILDIFGPTVEFLIAPDDEQSDFCVLKGIVPPGVFVPLHSHPDTEDFSVLSGEIECLRHNADGHEWIKGKVGDFFHMPNSSPHAWRNVSTEPVVLLIFTTKKLGHFFEETGRPWTGAFQPVTPEDIAQLVAASARYGYWTATPEENAAIGLQMGF